MIKYTRYYLLASAVLSGCSAPEASTRAYPQNAAVSSPAGVPHDSATSYFPAKAMRNPTRIKRGDTVNVKTQPAIDCASQYVDASQHLVVFKAPVLSNYFLGHTIYRFVWLRSFDRAVLLTLSITGSSGLLQTQLLNKPLGLNASVSEESQVPRMPEADSIAIAKRFGPRWFAQVATIRKERAGLVKLAIIPLVVLNERTVTVNQAQLKEFNRLLAQASFWQLPSCQELRVTDGAAWMLEAHTPNRYRVVYRQSPRGADGQFRRCCEFLLNLSPAKAEERY